MHFFSCPTGLRCTADPFEKRARKEFSSFIISVAGIEQASDPQSFCDGRVRAQMGLAVGTIWSALNSSDRSGRFTAGAPSR